LESKQPVNNKINEFISGTMAKFKYATNIQKRPAQENDLSKFLSSGDLDVTGLTENKETLLLDTAGMSLQNWCF
jgi:hypothetical protein